MAIVKCMLVALLFVAILGQSGTKPANSSQVHISGTTSQCGEAIPGVLVRFEGETSRVARANNVGAYEIDLPLGIWTATTPVSPSDPRSTSRPRHFRLISAGDLVLNIYLRPPVACSVAIYSPNGNPATPEQMSQRDAVCYGEEFFPLPSSDGFPFEVDLFGLQEAWKSCSVGHPSDVHRQMATYNLLSVEATQVSYHPNERTLEASGEAVSQDETGRRTARSMTFSLEEGRAILLHQIR